MILGLDFGLTNLDVVLVENGQMVQGWRQDTQGAPSLATLEQITLDLNIKLENLSCIGTTGGRHKDLPSSFKNVPILKIGEAQAVGRGGLSMAQLDAALVVSAGTGTSMIASRGSSFGHVTGSAVGGGTLLGLAKLLLGTSNPLKIAALAAKGNPAGVDSTLSDVLGSGIGHLPSDATAVNLGRVVSLEQAATPEDLAAGLVTLVSQVIAVIALNAANAQNLERIVIVGHLVDLEPVRAAIQRVWGFYGVEMPAIIPESRGFATALGAALEAGLEHEKSRELSLTADKLEL
jgi:type II pantothenate kinase